MEDNIENISRDHSGPGEVCQNCSMKILKAHVCRSNSQKKNIVKSIPSFESKTAMMTSIKRDYFSESPAKLCSELEKESPGDEHEDSEQNLWSIPDTSFDNEIVSEVHLPNLSNNRVSLKTILDKNKNAEKEECLLKSEICFKRRTLNDADSKNIYTPSRKVTVGNVYSTLKKRYTNASTNAFSDTQSKLRSENTPKMYNSPDLPSHLSCIHELDQASSVQQDPPFRQIVNQKKPERRVCQISPKDSEEDKSCFAFCAFLGSNDFWIRLMMNSKRPLTTAPIPFVRPIKKII
uniref:Uncharacterized protein n=1 Tax=Euplotes harpa TaxID=151035 RepID=A0A7S3N6C2_9SPIT|mmetsp:Transcript_16381/g.18925  ORF Transcript_16381/g.18925 Transcript_16381/m.18925 type:complete len:292 (+) Transcript_16381:14-889(+)